MIRGGRFVVRCDGADCPACVDVDVELGQEHDPGDLIALAALSLAGAMAWWTGPHGGLAAEATHVLAHGTTSAGLVERALTTKLFCRACWPGAAPTEGS